MGDEQTQALKDGERCRLSHIPHGRGSVSGVARMFRCVLPVGHPGPHKDKLGREFVS